MEFAPRPEELRELGMDIPEFWDCPNCSRELVEVQLEAKGYKRMLEAVSGGGA